MYCFELLLVSWAWAIGLGPRIEKKKQTYMYVIRVRVWAPTGLGPRLPHFSP